MTNDRGSAIELAAGAAILKIVGVPEVEKVGKLSPTTKSFYITHEIIKKVIHPLLHCLALHCKKVQNKIRFLVNFWPKLSTGLKTTNFHSV